MFKVSFKPKNIFRAVYYALLLVAVLVASFYLFLAYLSRYNHVILPASIGSYISELESFEDSEFVVLNRQSKIAIPPNWELISESLPAFAKIEGSEIVIDAKKENAGNLRLIFAPKDERLAGRLVKNIQIGLEQIDTEALRQEILAIMGSNSANMGLYFEDFVRGQKVLINEGVEFKPGSISKLPVGLLTLKDIDLGKRSLTDTFAVQNSLKHSRADAIGQLPQGTRVQIKQYLDELFKVSSNTAQYHLRVMLGGMEQLNPRTQSDLGSGAFYENPHIATPNAVGTVLRNVYLGKTLSEQWKNYFYDTLGAAAPSLRSGIPAGVPRGVRVVNKVGFLFGGADNTYSDAGFVFGNNTDYILVVFNNNAPRFPQGANVIREISQKVYSFVDKN